MSRMSLFGIPANSTIRLKYCSKLRLAIGLTPFKLKTSTVTVAYGCLTTLEIPSIKVEEDPAGAYLTGQPAP